MLFWGSKLGFIWWAVVSFLAGAACLLAASADAHLTDFVRSMAGESDAVSRLAAQIISEGLQFSGFAALILTAVLIVIWPALQAPFPQKGMIPRDHALLLYSFNSEIALFSS